MKLSNNPNIIKFFKSFEKMSTNIQKTDFLNEEILFLTRQESEQRLFKGKLSFFKLQF